MRWWTAASDGWLKRHALDIRFITQGSRGPNRPLRRELLAQPRRDAVLQPGARRVGLDRLAVPTGVPPRRINEIVHGTRGISADTALRLSKYFGTSAELSLKLLTNCEFDRAQDRAADQIAAITPLQVA